MQRNKPSGTVTFLFTDVEGSTKLLRERGADAYAQALAEHRRILRGAFGSHGGVEVDTQGDAFFVAFPTASGALRAAAAALEGLAPGPIRVRMGIHTGTPHLTEEGYVGVDVHRAARIAACGHGGQVLVSASTAALLGADKLRDLGEHWLKDLSAPERIFPLGDDEFPALKTLYRTNLPIAPTPLLGRQKEVTQVLELMAANPEVANAKDVRPLEEPASLPEVRLVTLTGPGGVGKTRFALEVAGRARPTCPDGVWWVPLQSVTDPALVMSSIGQVLGTNDKPAQKIQDSRTLLVLDNLEQLTAAAPHIAKLLAQCPRLRILATSREPLHIAGERQYPLPPLSTVEGVRLFLDRARAASPDFTDDGNVAAVCRRLDGLPLAIELAAARAKALSPRKILERLEQRLPDLVAGPRDLPERQQTLTATIAWSYDLLSKDERGLFSRLGVFAGGCTLPMAEEVCGATLDGLASLLDKSLLRREADRYLMLETIREFAVQRLEESGQAEKLKRSHAEHMSALVQPLALPVRLAERSAIEQLDAEYANCRSALDWALLQQDQPLCERLVEGLATYWLVSGRTAEGYRSARIALDQATSPAPWLLLTIGELARYSGDLDRALELKQLAVAAIEVADTPGALAVALTDLAETHIQREELAIAEELADRAVAIRTELGDSWGLAHARSAVIHLELRRRNYPRAAALAEQSIRVWRERRSWSDLAWEYFMASAAYRGLGRTDDAKDRLREGFRYALEIRERPAVVCGLEQTAALAAECGSDEIALRLVGAAQSWRRSSGDVFWRDDTAGSVSGSRIDDRRRDSLLAEGAEWEPEEAGRYALEFLAAVR